MRLLSTVTNHLFTEMKSLKLATTSLLIASALFAADGTVSSTGGNWSGSATWVDGTVPTTDGKIIYSDTSGTLTVDSSQTVSAIKSSVSGTVNIASGATLKLTATGSNAPVLDATSSKNTFTIKGVDNTAVLDLGSGNEMSIKNGTFVLNAKTTTARGLSLYSNVEIAYKDSNLYDSDFSYKGANYSGQNNSVLTIKSGASAQFASTANWGANSQLIIEEGAYLKTTGGVRSRHTSVSQGITHDTGNKLVVDGRLDITGVTEAKAWNDYDETHKVNFGLYATHAVVTGTLNITTTAANSYINQSLVNTGTINVAASLVLSDGAELTLGAGSNICTNGAASQAESIIDISMVEMIFNNRPILSTNESAANVTLNLQSDQSIGGFRMIDGSSLTINLKYGETYNKLALGVIGGSEYSVILEDFQNSLVSIGDTDSVSLDKFTAYGTVDGVRTELTDLQYKDGYIYSATMAIPEPAEWAAIFGAIALGLAVYRRRK